MEPDEFRKMVDDIRTVERARGVVSYARSPAEENQSIFRRSIFAVKDIRAGEEFTTENIRCIRPGSGLKPKYYERLIGVFHAAQDIPRGTPLTVGMITPDLK